MIFVPLGIEAAPLLSPIVYACTSSYSYLRLDVNRQNNELRSYVLLFKETIYLLYFIHLVIIFIYYL